MFSLASADALLDTFRPKDRAAYEPPPGVTFPLFVRDYLAWAHPSGAHAYLVFTVPGAVPTGIAFETNGSTPGNVPQLCDWCHQSGPGTQVALLTARVNAKKRVGLYVCADLGCRHRLEEQSDRTGRSVLPAMEKLLARIGRFASEALKIDLRSTAR